MNIEQYTQIMTSMDLSIYYKEYELVYHMGNFMIIFAKSIDTMMQEAYNISYTARRRASEHHFVMDFIIPEVI